MFKWVLIIQSVKKELKLKPINITNSLFIKILIMQMRLIIVKKSLLTKRNRIIILSVHLSKKELCNF
jgi:hypothetical protein